MACYDRIIWPYPSHVPCYFYAIFNCAIQGIIVVESTDVIISACLLPVDSVLQHLRQTDKLDYKWIAVDCRPLKAYVRWYANTTNTVFISKAMFCLCVYYAAAVT